MIIVRVHALAIDIEQELEDLVYGVDQDVDHTDVDWLALEIERELNLCDLADAAWERNQERLARARICLDEESE